MRRLALLAGVVLVAVTVLPAPVAQQSSPSASDSQTTFKATTRIVNVNVVVTDSRGDPITGLTQDDFKVFDRGKPQIIRFFEAINNVAPAPAAPLPPDTYTNQLRGAPPSVTALLVDVQHSDWAAQVYSLYRMRAFLRRLRPDDRIAIYLLTDHELTMLHDFTQDSSDLIAAIQRYDAQQTGPKDQRTTAQGGKISEIDRLLAGGDIEFHFGQEQNSLLCPGGCLGLPSVGVNVFRGTASSVQTVTSLADIARHLASAPGRKSLIWLYGATFDKGAALGATSLLPEESQLQDQLARRITGKYSSLPPKYHGFKAFLLGPDGPHDGEDRALRAIRAGIYSGDLVPLLVRVFNDEAIAVYPVGAEGLQTIGIDGPEDLGFRHPHEGSTIRPENLGFKNSFSGRTLGPWNSQGVMDRSLDIEVEIHQRMRSLAERTGGRAFYNRNDLETGIQHAVDDGRYSYELAYYPDHNDWHGEWRKIEVKLKDPDRYVTPPTGAGQEIKVLFVGGPSVHVLARGGYFALPEPQITPQPDRKELLTRAATSATGAADLPFTVQVVPMPDKENPEIHLLLNLDAHNLLTTGEGNHGKGNFELLFFELGQDKRRKQEIQARSCCALRNRSEVSDKDQVPVESYDLDLNPTEYQKALATGIAAIQSLKLRPGASTLAIVLHDKKSDALGAIRIPLARYAAAMQQPPPQ